MSISMSPMSMPVSLVGVVSGFWPTRRASDRADVASARTGDLALVCLGGCDDGLATPLTVTSS